MSKIITKQQNKKSNLKNKYKNNNKNNNYNNNNNRVHIIVQSTESVIVTGLNCLETILKHIRC